MAQNAGFGREASGRKILCTFRCDKADDSKATEGAKNAKLTAEADTTLPESARISETPTGALHLTVGAEHLLDFFEPGAKYAVEIKRIN